jgi:hypothetical protein
MSQSRGTDKPHVVGIHIDHETLVAKSLPNSLSNNFPHRMADFQFRADSEGRSGNNVGHIDRPFFAVCE